MAYSSSKKPSALNSASTPLAAGNQIVLDQNGNVVRASLADVEAKVFDAKTALSTPVGTEVVVVRQTDNTLRQVALSDIVPDLNITNASISASAAIADTKLATINTAGKVTNNAVQATSANTAGRIVTRDGSGNFAAGTITATLSGNASTATLATAATALATGRTVSLTGDITGTTGAFDGSTNVSAATTITNNSVTDAKLRDSSGLSVIGRSSDSTGDPSDIVALNDGGVLRRSGTSIGFGTVDTAGIADGSITQAKLNANVILVPPGAIMSFARTTAPTGWLAANGQTIGSSASGATFADALFEALFVILWTDWDNTLLPILDASGVITARGVSAAADWSANKRLPLPDLRDNFVRGSGGSLATFGSFQDYRVHNHTHSGTTGTESADHTHYVSGTTSTDGNHQHYYETRQALNNRAAGSGFTAHGNAQGAWTGFAGNHNHTFAATSGGRSAEHTHNFTTGNPSTNAGNETRPRNIALLYCIKF